MVEGQLDAIRCWSVGLKAAVAPQGTSITEPQLILLRRYAQQIECFFDSDGAGQKAALRLLPMALKAGLEVRFLTLAGAGKIDPDLLFLEQGLPAYELDGLIAPVAPAGLPKTELARLYNAFKAAMEMPEARDALVAQGYEIKLTPPDAAAAFFRSEAARMAQVVKNANVKLD
jgi:tripartite-type tricarboxylate transporter receptor subunit TctC